MIGFSFSDILFFSTGVLFVAVAIGVAVIIVCTMASIWMSMINNFLDKFG